MPMKSSILLRGTFRSVFGSKRSTTMNNSNVQSRSVTESMCDSQSDPDITLVSVRRESEALQKYSSDIDNKSISSNESVEGMIDRYYMYAEEDDDNERVEITREGTTQHGPEQLDQHHIDNDWDQNSLIERPKCNLTEKCVTAEFSSPGRSKLIGGRSKHLPPSLVKRRSPAGVQGCCHVVSYDEESEESSVETLDILMAHFKCGDSGIDVAIEDWDLPKCRTGNEEPVNHKSGLNFEGIEVVPAYDD